ncbi:MAG: T9SS type A sorting domain-containing protein [Flavobacteriales bacterium]
MKPLFSCIGMFLFSMLCQAQQLPNADFEQWSTPPGTSHEVPTGWSGTNDITGQLGITPVTKSSNPVQNGQFAVRMESIDFIGNAIPGFIAKAKLDFVDGNTAPGIAFTARPDSLTGFFQYFPEVNDEAAALCLLTKWVGNGRDTIGGAFITYGLQAEQWTRMSIPLFYLDSSAPDSLLLIFSASSDFDNAIPGSVLFLDNLAFKGGTVGLMPISFHDQGFQVYPNPANDFIHVKNVKAGNLIQIINMQGRCVLETRTERSEFQIDTTDLPEGIYLVKSGREIQKIMIKH